MEKALCYLTGFGNEHATEALPATLPAGQNSPQRAPRGLYTEQISGTPFTAPRAENRRSWLYRIRPSAMHPPFRRIDNGRVRSAPLDEVAPPPNRLRWSPLPFSDEPTDFIDGLVTMGGNGDASGRRGVAVHIYCATRSMEHRLFYDADGELLIVPQTGRLRLATEFGMIETKPGEVAVIPRGIKFGSSCRMDARAATSAKTTARSSGCPNWARSAPTASPIRAISASRSPPSRTATNPARWSPNSTAGCGRPNSTIRHSTSSLGTATTRRTFTTSRASIRSTRVSFDHPGPVDLHGADLADPRCPAPPTAIS